MDSRGPKLELGEQYTHLRGGEGEWKRLNRMVCGDLLRFQWAVF